MLDAAIAAEIRTPVVSETLWLEAFTHIGLTWSVGGVAPVIKGVFMTKTPMICAVINI